MISMYSPKPMQMKNLGEYPITKIIITSISAENKAMSFIRPGFHIWYREKTSMPWWQGVFQCWGIENTEEGSYTVAVVVDDKSKKVRYIYACGNISAATEKP